jgi:hypothetical protein
LDASRAQKAVRSRERSVSVFEDIFARGGDGEAAPAAGRGWAGQKRREGEAGFYIVGWRCAVGAQMQEVGFGG